MLEERKPKTSSLFKPLHYISNKVNQVSTGFSDNFIGVPTIINDSNIREFVHNYLGYEGSGNKKHKLPWNLKDTPISDWNVEHVTDMSKLFSFTNFNEDLSKWEISSVTNMEYMFENCSRFNQKIGSSMGWTFSKVTSMRGMFKNCISFNQKLSWINTDSIKKSDRWINTSKVIDMSEMFYGCKSFNQELKFDITNVRNMRAMFYGCTNFVGLGLDTWNVRNVKNMSFMFYGCQSLRGTFDSNSDKFNNWAISSTTDTTDMFTGSSMEPIETIASFEEVPIAESAPLHLLPNIYENIASYTGIGRRINTAEPVPIALRYHDTDGGKKRKMRIKKTRRRLKKPRKTRRRIKKTKRKF